MRMTALERRLGVQLVERLPSGTRLTPAGVEVVSAARRILTETALLMAAVERLRDQSAGRLAVAASATVADHLLPTWLGVVHRSVPDSSLALEVTNSAGVLSAVRAGRVDIGFLESDEPGGPELESTTISRDRLVVAVGPTHPWASRAPLHPEELAATELIVRERGSGTRQVLERALAPWGGVRSRLELGSPYAIVEALRADHSAVAVLSDLVVAEDVAAGRLAVVEVQGLNLHRSLCATWRADRRLPALARRLLDAASAPRPGSRSAPAASKTLAR
jgi:DNA-binding transcriptional LysR family regulator